MKRNIILNILLFLIGVFLQVILVGTSPKIDCSEIWNQFYILLNSLIIEYAILIVIQITILIFLKRKTKELVASFLLFTILYLIVFVYLFYNYHQEICR